MVIEGNDNLQFGENTVTIKVTAEDGITIKTYTILVHRKTEEEEAKEQEVQEDLDEQKEKLSAPKNKFNWWLVGSAILIIIIIIAYLFWRRNKNKNGLN